MQRLKGQGWAGSVEMISVNDILQQGVKLFSINKGMHRVSVDCPPDLPPIKGDSEKLHQVMINLLSNACKYSPPGSAVVVSASRSEEMIVIAVKDEGIGIPPEMRDKVFERFYRIDNSDRRMVGGTGLGLALVKDIIDAHGGRIWVEGRAPKGSAIYFSLPIYS